jgi:antitoxin (DNA-binding transcriptional repressor) of toxin-antitoxin stability system
MSSVSLDEAQAKLPELLEQLEPGEEISITDHGRVLALRKKPERTSWPCKAGSARGKIRMASDFDAPLEEFKEYME